MITFSQSAIAQCDKNVLFKSSLVREVKDGNPGEEMPIEATLTFKDNRLLMTLQFAGISQTINGSINKVLECKWTEYLKNGKAQYKVLTNKEGESAEDTLITIESKNGQTTITIAGDPDNGTKLQFDIVEYTIMD